MGMQHTADLSPLVSAVSGSSPCISETGCAFYIEPRPFSQQLWRYIEACMCCTEHAEQKYAVRLVR
jgi:hypothetical protein